MSEDILNAEMAVFKGFISFVLIIAIMVALSGLLSYWYKIDMEWVNFQLLPLLFPFLCFLVMFFAPHGSGVRIFYMVIGIISLILGSLICMFFYSVSKHGLGWH